MIFLDLFLKKTFILLNCKRYLFTLVINKTLQFVKPVQNLTNMKRIIILSLSAIILMTGCKFFGKKDIDKKLSSIEQQRIDDSIKFVNQLNQLKDDSQKRIDSVNSACANPSYTYYVITGSFKNPANAENFSSQMISLGYKSHIITISNGFHLVSASSGNDQAQAFQALANLRQAVNQEAWLFVNK